MKKLISLFAVLGLFACAEKPISLDGEYVMLNAPEDAEITIGFEGERFFGKAAVNNYFGSFTKTDKTIKFGPAGSTMMAGPEPLMKVESTYLQDLAKIDGYNLQGKTLILSGPDNLSLTFEKK